VALILLLWACSSAPVPTVYAEQSVGEARFRAVPGSNARLEGGVLSVDAPDGWSWFDAREVDAAGPAMGVAHAWAEGACRPVRWDVPATPIPGVWTSGGTCTIDQRRFWLLVAVEDIGGRRWMTTAQWRLGHKGYEEAWVSFVGAALSVHDGSGVSEWIPEAELRQRLRAIPPDDGTRDQLPLPGGGTFSTRVSEVLRDVWAARQANARLPRLTQPGGPATP
jgi:hypothetical protein